ncbi:hypothetical protein K1719_046829 [Acacia pycnantha]|nr:hypothetical protein K1719_046829 [Acacia pycnantha]
MLLAVEGGGFFSSSALGYSKGLTLLLLGQRSEDKPMKVSPWNQYQLVDQESDPELQLASTKNRISRGCASFVCFGRASAGLDTPSPLKVGPAQQHDVSPGSLVSDKDQSSHLDNIERRKVQWTDTCGNELTEIREFEPSEVDGSDDEFDNENDRACSCAIM